MASATGIPQTNPHDPSYGEDEPLLGRAGDASQQDGLPLYYNLGIGTAPIAQVGAVLLAGQIWASIFLSPLMLFSAHPLLNSAGLLVLLQSALILQPTHTATQKRNGTLVHASLNSVAASIFIAGLVVIEVNKFAHNGTHFESGHAIRKPPSNPSPSIPSHPILSYLTISFTVGLITYILLLIQSLIGFTQYFTPSLYGSVANAKSIYKYHRALGYVIAVLMLATICAATWTTFNVKVLKIKSWAVIVSSVLILLGVVPRIKKQKFGLK
ncbi:hypothetical protein CJF30_00003747 [Rutstroemia sp. NJR-2017a BBW]|nr:hypothetical protein CJF30_00003747 [Rutstroemia sp. NJR-2017a BBW]